MKKQYEEYIESLIKRAVEAGSASEALHYSQAACNAANAIITLHNMGGGKGGKGDKY